MTRLAHAAALQGGGARLPLLPRAGPGAGRADRGDAGARPAPRCRSCRPRASSATGPTTGCRATWPARWSGGASWAASSRRACAAGERQRGRDRAWTTGELVACLREQGIEDPRESKLSPRRARGAGGDGRGPHALAVRGEGGARRADRERAATRRRSWRRAGWRRSPTAASWRRSSSARSRRTPRAVEQIRSGKAQAAGAIVGAVMKETKGRADGAEVNRLIREKLGL